MEVRHGGAAFGGGVVERRPAAGLVDLRAELEQPVEFSLAAFDHRKHERRLAVAVLHVDVNALGVEQHAGEIPRLAAQGPGERRVAVFEHDVGRDARGEKAPDVGGVAGGDRLIEVVRVAGHLIDLGLGEDEGARVACGRRVGGRCEGRAEQKRGGGKKNGELFHGMVHASSRRMGRRKSLTALAVVCRATCALSTPKSPARHSATYSTYCGSHRLPRMGTGAM